MIAISNEIMLFTDFHAYSGFTEFSDSDKEYKNSRFRNQCEVLDGILNTAEKENIPVIFGGDLFHVRQKVDIFDFNNIFRIFANHPKVEVYLLRGNHDSINNLMGSPSSIDSFNFLPNVKVITNPEKIYINHVNVFFMPYGEDKDFIRNKLKEFSDTANRQGNQSLLVGHLGINGAELMGTKAEGEFNAGDFYPDIFDFIYMGHYHKRQRINGLDTFIYGGSTIQNTFSDAGQDKGYDILSFDGNTVYDKFITSSSPKFFTFSNYDDTVKEVIDRGNFVRINAPEEEVKKISLSEDDESKVRISPIKNFDVNSRLDISPDDSVTEVVAKFLKDKGIDALEEAKEVLP